MPEEDEANGEATEVVKPGELDPDAPEIDPDLEETLDEEEEDEEDGESEHPEDTRQIIGGERVDTPPAA